ncbi:ATP-grasp domain-containing protein [Methyloglobulus sp.]|uniref:ATP-grasp domain-containing protein n=1 Tax=Methyloglobulus sp. TaxID=2518622 RepID=UPI00398933CC
MGRIAIFTDDPGWHGKELGQAFAKLGFRSDFVSLTECRLTIEPGQIPVKIPGFEQVLPDAAFVRGVPGGSLEEVVLYLDILHALKLLNVPVYNDGHAIERSVDKAMTSFLLHQAGLPTPLAWALKSRADSINIAENELKKGHFLITKPLFGSQGDGIRRIEKMTDLFWLAASKGVYYFQRFVHCAGDGFSDYRVFVVNNRAVAIMRRRGKSWLNNVARGAASEAIDLDPAIADIAVKAAKALVMDYAGVDIIQDRVGQYTVIEVNSIPAWKGLESVGSVNIAALLAEDLVNRHIKRTIPEAIAARS